MPAYNIVVDIVFYNKNDFDIECVFTYENCEWFLQCLLVWSINVIYIVLRVQVLSQNVGWLQDLLKGQLLRF